jgi:hypothetical protein
VMEGAGMPFRYFSRKYAIWNGVPGLFFSGIDITNTFPSDTEFWVTMSFGITRPEESYCVFNCVCDHRNPPKGALCPSWEPKKKMMRFGACF